MGRIDSDEAPERLFGSYFAATNTTPVIRFHQNSLSNFDLSASPARESHLGRATKSSRLGDRLIRSRAAFGALLRGVVYDGRVPSEYFLLNRVFLGRVFCPYVLGYNL